MKWVKRLSLILGILLLLSSLLGTLSFLPVDTIGFVVGLISVPESGTYYKVVPTENAEYSIGMLILVGLALVLWGRSKSKNSGANS